MSSLIVLTVLQAIVCPLTLGLAFFSFFVLGIFFPFLLLALLLFPLSLAMLVLYAVVPFISLVRLPRATRRISRGEAAPRGLLGWLTFLEILNWIPAVLLGIAFLGGFTNVTLPLEGSDLVGFLVFGSLVALAVGHIVVTHRARNAIRRLPATMVSLARAGPSLDKVS